MTTWIKLSDRQPTEEDFNVGVVYGYYDHDDNFGWYQSDIRKVPSSLAPSYTHWQRVSPPEQPRLRRWWLMNTNNVGLSLIIAFDKPMTGAAQVIEWPYEADPVPPKDKRERKR